MNHLLRLVAVLVLASACGAKTAPTASPSSNSTELTTSTSGAADYTTWMGRIRQCVLTYSPTEATVGAALRQCRSSLGEAPGLATSDWLAAYNGCISSPAGRWDLCFDYGTALHVQAAQEAQRAAGAATAGAIVDALKNNNCEMFKGLLAVQKQATASTSDNLKRSTSGDSMYDFYKSSLEQDRSREKLLQSNVAQYCN